MTIRSELAGKRALVTAGAAGIGLAIATALRDAGAELWVCDIDEKALAACADRFKANRTDVGVRADVDALFDALDHAWGGLDILVNNAGIAGPTAGIDEIDPDAWSRTIDVNLTSAFYTTRRAVPWLRNSAGSIVNISSVAGRLGYAYRTPYAATKWALIGLTESLAKELGPDGVRVNAVMPGIVAGPRIDAVFASRAEATGRPVEEVEAGYLEKVSLRRKVSAEDVANTVRFLCGPAGANISGQSISVCGNVEAI